MSSVWKILGIAFCLLLIVGIILKGNILLLSMTTDQLTLFPTLTGFTVVIIFLLLINVACNKAGIFSARQTVGISRRAGRAVKRRFAIFAPILVGATLRGRLFAVLGALVGISMTGLICGALLGGNLSVPLIVAPMGASAVLLFAVPSSPLAQPWSIIGGNTLSALTGIVVVHFVNQPVLAIGIGVCLAIAVMSLARCLHPPGGAAALTAVLGGKAVVGWGFLFPLLPVGINSCLLVAVGVIFHKMLRHSYPHKSPISVENIHHTRDVPPQLRIEFTQADIATVLERRGESYDIAPDDFESIISEVMLQSFGRNGGGLRSQDIMSQDVVSIGLNVSISEAVSLLLHHNIRTLPVVDSDNKLAGTVGLRDLVSATGDIVDYMSPAICAAPDDLAVNFVTHLTAGKIHAIIVIDPAGRILGIISQTDLLATLCRIGPDLSRNDMPIKRRVV